MVLRYTKGYFGMTHGYQGSTLGFSGVVLIDLQRVFLYCIRWTTPPGCKIGRRRIPSKRRPWPSIPASVRSSIDTPSCRRSAPTTRKRRPTPEKWNKLGKAPLGECYKIQSFAKLMTASHFLSPMACTIKLFTNVFVAFYNQQEWSLP